MTDENAVKRQRWPWVALALLGALEVTALCLFCSWHLSRTTFWYDESMQFWMSLGIYGFGPPQVPPGSLRDVIHQNAVDNLDPGGFTTIMWLWLKLATGAVWQRALPFIFFLFGMACFGWIGWARRRSAPFAVFSSLVPACDPLLLDYATEVRAYSMEFAGIAFGCVLLDVASSRRDILPALCAGIVFSLFLSSRYSFGLFVAAAAIALTVAMLTDERWLLRRLPNRGSDSSTAWEAHQVLFDGLGWLRTIGDRRLDMAAAPRTRAMAYVCAMNFFL